jgi:hypothetical protein
MVQAILESIYFFHPAVWWSSRQLRQLREDACDEATVATLGQRKAYGSALISAAEILGYAPPPLALGVLDSPHPIASRVHRILDPSLPVAPIATARYATVLLVTALILLPAGPKPAPATPSQTVATPKEILQSEPLPSEATPSVDLESPMIELNGRLPVPPTAVEIARCVDRLTYPALRHEAKLELQSFGSVAEPDVIRLVKRADTASRIAAYEVLGVIGNESSRDLLQLAYLERTGPEQFAAQRALEAVLGRVRSSAPRVESTGSQRMFAPKSNQGAPFH